MTKFAHRASLDLSDPFAGEIEVLPDLFERSWLSAVETKSQPEDLPLAPVERGEKVPDLIREEGQRGGFKWRLCQPVFNNVTEFSIPILTKWLRERQGHNLVVENLCNFLLGQSHLDPEFYERRGAAELGLELSLCLLHEHHEVAGMDRQPDRASGVGDAAVIAWRIHHVA